MDNKTKENEKDPIHRIKLKRHLWPDEVELRNTKRNVVFWKRIAVVTLVAGLGIGWLSGSFVPLPFTGSLRTALRGVFGLHGDKVSAVKDIMEKLSFKNGRVFAKSFARDNLTYVVRHSEDKMTQLVQILQKVPGSGIVYVRSRAKTKQIAE